MLRALDEFVYDLYLREGVGFSPADFTHVSSLRQIGCFFIYKRYGMIFLRICVPIKAIARTEPNRQNGLKGALLSSLGPGL